MPIDKTLFRKVYNNFLGKLEDDILIDPIPSIPVVTQNDAQNGYIFRYFCRPISNKHFVTEIDEQQFNKLKDNPRFVVAKLRWKIVGVKETSYTPSGVPIYGVGDLNRITTANLDLTFGGLRQYIVDYQQFWIGETIY